MKKALILLCLSCAVSLCYGNDPFVRVKDGKFYIADKPYSYVGTNFWYGALLGSPGKGGDRARLTRELDFLKKNGIDNLRVLVGGDGADGVPSRIEPTLQKEPGIYDDDILDGLDFLLKEMGKRNMRAVLYLNNSWEWSGGYSQYLEWAGAGKAPIPAVDGWNAFMAYVGQYVFNQEAQALFSRYVYDILSRTNRYTGLKYTDDPAIMSWQIGNEPRAFSDAGKEAFAGWIAAAAAQIKALDKNHLVSTGSEGKAGCEGDLKLYESIHSDGNIDYLTIHIWPKNWGWAHKESLADDLPEAIANTRTYIDEHAAIARKCRKPIVLEEFGFPRDEQSFLPGSPTESRDRYYEAVFSSIRENRKNDGCFAGCNFWGWGGFARPVPEHIFWKSGDDYTGDPAQEEQGLNSVFSNDRSTLKVIRKYTRLLKK